MTTTTLLTRGIGLLALLVSISACDRFAHAKFEKSPWGTESANASSSSSSSSSNAFGGAVDVAAPTCQSPSNGTATGNVSSGGTASMSGIGAEDSFCTAANDCAPVCCSCDDGREWLAASCVANRCAGGDVACNRTGTCASGAAPAGGAIIIAGGGSGSGSGSRAGGCGLTYDNAACDACMSASCCQAEATCASDPTCSSSVDACVSQCAGDDACAAACDDALASNSATANLEACLLASCASACQ